MRRNKLAHIGLAMVTLAVLGCDDDDGDSGNAAVVNCNRFLEIYSSSVIKNCAGAEESDRDNIKRSVESGLPGTCAEAQSIRDSVEFEDCLSSIGATTECITTAEMVPSACRSQILFAL